MSADVPTRDELAERYLAQLPYAPYPVQEEALLAWFTAEQGVLVCAPTGTGKTLIAQAALFEALHTGTVAYYTTPLIALTEQKFQEMQAAAVRWGFQADDVGLVTGNRRVNPNARVLVVVAEILLNRLLHAIANRTCPTMCRSPEAFDFTRVSAVVMDEFHNFADPQRGIVWELALALLPAHIRLLLLSATVGNAARVPQLAGALPQRKLELVEGKERKVPLTFRWVPDEFLGEQLVHMAKGEGENRTTPALVFCFNRDECWSVAEMLKGLDLLAPGMRGRLNDEVDKLDWTKGVGPKLKQMLRRGVGVHHAGLLPKYRRVVEELFEKQAAGRGRLHRDAGGRHQPAGPLGGADFAGQGTARQGKADRRQHGPSDFRPRRPAAVRRPRLRLRPGPRGRRQDPALEGEVRRHSGGHARSGPIKAKKALKKKKPTRRENARVLERGAVPAIAGGAAGQAVQQGAAAVAVAGLPAETVAGGGAGAHGAPQAARWTKPRIKASEKALDRMLLTLADRGFVTLDPPLPQPEADASGSPKPSPHRRWRCRRIIKSSAPCRRRRSIRCSSSAACIRCTARS